MRHLFFIFIFFLLEEYYNCEIIIKNVELRHLRVKDIGLIFDMTVYNDPSKKKETFDFRIRCDKCCIKAPKNSTTCDVAQLIGGNFGEIMPGYHRIISLLWPTVTLYNRVGYCDIILLSSSKSGAKIRISHTINFDTTINTKLVTEHVRGFLADVNYVDCISPDLNPTRNCTPVDCEEKYFGRRNFFNTITNLCEEVPDCSFLDSKNTYYDFTINECIDVKRFVCQEHIRRLQHGRYDKNVWKPKHHSGESVSFIF